ncbi:MAG: hypothetical protein ACP6IU_05710 [Candidatus Asgardarchaeia archaeon]
MVNLKYDKWIFTSVIMLYVLLVKTTLDFLSTMPDKIATSWLITGEVTRFSTKQNFVIGVIFANLILIGLLIIVIIVLKRSKREFVYVNISHGFVKIRSEYAPNYVGVLIIVLNVTMIMYMQDIMMFNTSGTFFFFNFPFIILYVAFLFAVVILFLRKYGVKSNQMMI